MADYPERKSHFAHKLVRRMGRTCAAQEIGINACWLITIIAHTEDAKHYTAPVTFWNDQLQSILAFGSPGMLGRARKKAVEAGWLHYEQGGKAKVGKYWAMIPKRFEDIPDGAFDEDTLIIPSASGNTNSQETALSFPPADGQAADKPVILSTGGQTSVGQTEDKRRTNGNHSTLTLNPTPNPKEKSGDVPIPTELDTPRFREAWTEWLAYRRQEKFTVKPIPTKAQLTKLKAWGVDGAITAINAAMASGWKGLFEQRGKNGPNQQSRPARGRIRDQSGESQAGRYMRPHD